MRTRSTVVYLELHFSFVCLNFWWPLPMPFPLLPSFQKKVVLRPGRRNRRQLSFPLTQEGKFLLPSKGTLPMGLLPTGVAFSLWTHVFLPQLSESCFMLLTVLSGVLASQTHLSSAHLTQQPTQPLMNSSSAPMSTKIPAQGLDR